MKISGFKMFFLIFSFVLSFSSAVFAQASNDAHLEFDVATYDVTTGDSVTTATQEIGQVLIVRNLNDQRVAYSDIETAISTITLDSLTGQNIPLIVNPVIPGAGVVSNFGKVAVKVSSLPLGMPLSKGKYVLKSKFLVKDLVAGGAPANRRVFVEEVIDVAEAAGSDAVYDLIENVNWSSIEQLSTSGTNWTAMQVQSNAAVNWNDLKIMTVSNINWTDLRRETWAGVNWNDLRSATIVGVNWTDLKVMTKSGINWPNF